MTALADRLRQLRAQTGQSTSAPAPQPAPAAPRPALPANVRSLLLRHAQIRRTPSTVQSKDREVAGDEIAPGLRYTEARTPWLHPPAVIDASFARMESLPAHRLLHFDTETTGLAGGTGTRAFMIGAADWVDGRFRIRQLTITSMAAETAMLRAFAAWLSPDSVLVSYNGKCYDAPLLATRYRLARLPNPLQGLAHLDLLHPVRRQWKGVWENCRLGTVERHLLGVVREDDLPGAEAPAAWLSYLRGGSAVNLRRVAQHNAQDLKSLAGVLLHMARCGAVDPLRDADVPVTLTRCPNVRQTAARNRQSSNGAGQQPVDTGVVSAHPQSGGFSRDD